MRSRHAVSFRLPVARLLLLVVTPLACARGVDPDDSYGDDVADAGSGGSGSASQAGSGGSNSGGKPSTAGSGPSAAGGTGTSGGTPSGGTASSGNGGGGAAGSSGGTTTGGKGGGAGAGGKGGAGGAGGTGTGGASGGSGGSGTACNCSGEPMKWMDNANISWSNGACFTVDTATYVYVGMKMQTYANGSCNPTKQLSWCTNSDSDYKFMLCK